MIFLKKGFYFERREGGEVRIFGFLQQRTKKLTSASLRYPLSVFNKNSTLKQTNGGGTVGPLEDPHWQAQRSQILSHNLVLLLLTGREVHDCFPDFQMLT